MRPSYEDLLAAWDARTGLVPYGSVPLAETLRRLRRALPTSAHAKRLVDALLARLADRGRLDPYTNGLRLMVVRCDAEGWWARQPLALWCEDAEYNETYTMGEWPLQPEPLAPDEGADAFDAPPEPDILPPGLPMGTLTFFHGPAALEIRYDQRGLVRHHGELVRFGDIFHNQRFGRREPPSVHPLARPPQWPPPAWLVDLPEGIDVDGLADRIAAIDPAADPVAVRMPVDAPGGVEGCWWRAKAALMHLAHTDRLPAAGGWVVLDTYEHPPDETWWTHGASRAEALERWLEGHDEAAPRPVRRPEPEPLPPLPPPEPTKETHDEDGKLVSLVASAHFHIRVEPMRWIPWPIPGRTSTPAVALRIPALPEAPPAWRAAGFTVVRHLIGESGMVSWALVRITPDATVLVGCDLVDAVDPADLDMLLLEADAVEDPFPFPDGPPWHKYPYETKWYRCWSLLTNSPGPMRSTQSAWNAEPPVRDLDGDFVRVCILRGRYRTD